MGTTTTCGVAIFTTTIKNMTVAMIVFIFLGPKTETRNKLSLNVDASNTTIAGPCLEEESMNGRSRKQSNHFPTISRDQMLSLSFFRIIAFMEAKSVLTGNVIHIHQAGTFVPRTMLRVVATLKTRNGPLAKTFH